MIPMNTNLQNPGLPGVFTATKKDGILYYRSSITYRSKHISLGSFSDALSASKAYEEASCLVKGSKTIHDYPEDASLPFEKWIVLINFRDNGLYFSTPIFIGMNMIYYYLSPSEVLKFDRDELFFYASHKISRRGGHLFVAEYGSQISILSRYGIKPYGILGKDYRSLNGDPFDYRSTNIEILSSYHGVSLTSKNGVPYYKAKIHVNGDYIIGTYKTMVEAAIAYNKAADYLRSLGSKKAYPINTIDEIRPSEYAEIYASLTISEKLASITFS